MKDIADFCDYTDEAAAATKVANLKGLMEFEQPNNRLYNFTGRITLDTEGVTKEALPISPDNIILRGKQH